MKIKILILLLAVIISSCSTCNQEEEATQNSMLSDHSHTMATLYSFYAEEYRGLCYQAYNLAQERVAALHAEYPERKDFAIVVDIDETLLDNSPHQALSIVTDSAYPYMWNEWCNLEKAKAVPGAVEFLQYADELGFNIFYVSNRKDKYVQTSTMNNLKNVGFPQVDESHILLKLELSDENPDPSNKQMRRDLITANGFEIVLLIGDNLGDFYTDEQDHVARSEQLESMKEEFGRKFIILPNAMYGNWANSLGITDPPTIDSLLTDMIPAFN